MTDKPMTPFEAAGLKIPNHVADGFTTKEQQNLVKVITAHHPKEKPITDAGHAGFKDIEICVKCGEPTGRAGRADDSLYDENDNGPYCWECFEKETQ